MSGHCTLGNVISAAAAVGLVLVYINLQPEYELSNLTRLSFRTIPEV